MKKRYLAVVLGLLGFFWVSMLSGVSVIYAQTTSPSNYDWSSTLEFSQSHVLGQTVSAEGLRLPPPSSQAGPASEYLRYRYSHYLLGSELTPSSPFYFMKRLQENIQLTFTFDTKTKNMLRIQIAGERLEEMEKLVDSNNIKAITASAKEYGQSMAVLSNTISTLDRQNNNTDDLLKQLEEETAKHTIILEQVKVQVPDQVEDTIDGALEASWKGSDTIADLKDRPAVPSYLVSRLQSIESQGLLTSEEVNKLVNVKSRVEARKEMRKYVNDGVISESDLLGLSETVKSFYPNEFYKIHETLRFQEMQKFEEQKPDSLTLDKIQSFAKTYKQGDQVPVELRKYWVPIVRLEEIQNTLRPDLIDSELFKQNSQELKKFNEVVERFKPRPEDIAFIKNFIQKNNADIDNLPPEYQRMYNLGQRYGAQCGTGFNWIQESQSPAGGYCAPHGLDVSSLQKYEDYTKGKTCTGTIINVKGPNGVCSAYPSDCVPQGWSKTNTCVSTPETTTNTVNKIECPSNSHFVPVSYDPNGGYCIPNYTQMSNNNSIGTSGKVCPTSFHRSYEGGSCVPDYTSNTFNNPYSLPRLTNTPGGPYYTNGGQCGVNANWVPEQANPLGGYCTQTQETNGVPRIDMGNCRTPDECYNFCQNNPTAASCAGFNPSQPRPGYTVTPSRESQEAACRAGGGVCVSWVNDACGCERSGSSTNPTYQSPSRESQEAACRAGGGVCVSWVNDACGCERTNSGSTPPQGYGSCPSEQYWNGSSCQQNSSSTQSTPSESPEEACKRGTGCTWTGSSCSCSSSDTTQPQVQTSDPAVMCTQTTGCSWTGSSCQCNPQ